jgi:diguanylate cyclase (GGDEF)-like protein
MPGPTELEHGKPCKPAEPIRILIADDDDVDREHILRCLRHYPGPTSVRQADSLSSAMSAMNHETFQIIIVDGDLGDGAGLDVVAHLGENGGFCAVILATGFSTERGAVNAIRSGVYDYIPKAELDAARLTQVIAGGLLWSTAQAALAKADRQLRQRSLYDSLTGLPNRDLFFDRLEQACGNYLRYNVPFGVMMMDLDRFKAVNDTLGHAAGDQVLQQASKRLLRTCRSSDTISRLDGDEFGAICQGVNSRETSGVIAEKMLTGLEPPMMVEGRALSVGISIGIAFCPLHGDTPAALMAAADKAMYLAKAGTNKAVCMPPFSQATPAPLLAEALVNELDHAIINREFVMFYQPKIHLKTYQIQGVEALMRWRHPSGRVVEPDSFIPTIEKSNILSKFTLMSIDMALEQMANWAQRGVELNVAVNISARMLEDTELARNLRKRLDHFGIAAERLTLEITETAIIENPDAARKVVEQIAAIGVSMSIDDFGVGFTSFNYLRELSIPEIKLDKTFIIGLKQDSFGASLVKCMSTFCESEGIRLIAEGVEHRESWALLCDLGCTIGQGYSIARPASATQVEAWLTNTKAARDTGAYCAEA